MTRRLFVVGTDTAVGKTSVTAALLGHARAAGLRALPFKPAASGGDDPERLLAAASLEPALLPRIAPLRYDAPLAPGVAENAAAFTGPPADPPQGPSARTPTNALIAQILADLSSLEAEQAAELTIVEGAGGWHVPMPGATWQPQWVKAFAAPVILVGRLGLGTINHTLLTAAALERAGVDTLGFILSATQPQPQKNDPSTRDNPAILARACALPLLGILEHNAAAISFTTGAAARIFGPPSSTNSAKR